MLEDLVAAVEMEEPGQFTYPDGARTLTMRVGNRGNGGTSGGNNAFGTGGSSTVADGGNGGGAGQRVGLVVEEEVVVPLEYMIQKQTLTLLSLEAAVEVVVVH